MNLLYVSAYSLESKMKKILFLFFLMASSGCATSEESGGGFGSIINGEPVVPRNANTVIIAAEEYRAMPEISRSLAIKVKDQINMDGRLAVTGHGENADLRLDMKVSSYALLVIKYDTMGRPEKKRVRIAADLKLTDMKNGRYIFYDREIQSFVEYSDIIPPVTSDIQALDSVIDGLAVRIRAKTITGCFTKYLTPEERGKRK